MKTIPIKLMTALRKPGRSTCFLIKVVCKDGDVVGFTSLDTNVRFDDGIHSVVYSSREQMQPQNLQHTNDFSVDNTDLLGWFDDEMEKLVVSGKLSLGEVTIYRCTYQQLDNGVEIVGYGNVGEVDFAENSKGKRKIEFRSLMQQLRQVVNDMYSLTCRADFGDERCGMPFVWETGVVGTVTDPRLIFTITGLTRGDGWFDFGVVEFTDGDNVGKQLEVETWYEDGLTTLSFVTPYPVKPGDGLRIRRDCGKTFTDCKNYGNVPNMRAEHLTPVENSSLMVPGAFVRSVGAQ